MICAGILLVALAGSPVAQQASSPPVESFYQRGLHALDARQWNEAISAFAECVAHKGASADAALYWKAYAENREARGEQALSTLAQLRHSYPDSRWIHDAQALALEIRTQAGDPVNPSAETDDSLKLIALNSLMQSEPEKAVPILKKLLTSNNSEKIKDRALFVLNQNRSPEARQLLASIARGSADPALQTKAIRYMGMMGNDASRKDLAAIYSSSSNQRVKKAILQSMFLAHDSAKLAEIARTEKDPAPRMDAIKFLGLMRGNGEGNVLVSIY
ncbi:MAG: HEAT repeat domain-containing protein, partial [Bryobacteraceae bacterium]